MSSWSPCSIVFLLLKKIYVVVVGVQSCLKYFDFKGTCINFHQQNRKSVLIMRQLTWMAILNELPYISVYISFLCDKFDIFVHWCKSTYSKGFIKSAGLKRSLGSKATVHQLFIFSKLKFFEWPQWKREETDVFEHITVKQIKLLEIALHTMLQYMSG